MAIQVSLGTPTEIVNAALVSSGHTDRIGDLYDGTETSKVALAVYGQTRDALLREFDPGFAQKSDNLTLLKSAPPGGYIPGVNPWNPTTYPPLPWLYEYNYPSDCLRIRGLLQQTIFLPNFSPQSVQWREFEDGTLSPPALAIACNIPDATIIYTQRLTDPSQWEATFIQTLVERLTVAIGPAIARINQSGALAEKSGEGQSTQDQNTDVTWQS